MLTQSANSNTAKIKTFKNKMVFKKESVSAGLKLALFSTGDNDACATKTSH